jgi:hypothetical protein
MVLLETVWFRGQVSQLTFSPYLVEIFRRALVPAFGLQNALTSGMKGERHGSKEEESGYEQVCDGFVANKSCYARLPRNFKTGTNGSSGRSTRWKIGPSLSKERTNGYELETSR